MKRILTKLLVLVGLPMAFVACKKDDPDPLLENVLGSMTMNIDGTPWHSSMAYVVTASDEEEDVYAVAISGFQQNEQTDTGDGLVIWLAIPRSKFDNPKGTYDIVVEDSDLDGNVIAWALFQKSMGLETQQLYGVNNPTTSVGTVTITDFEIGQQTFLGQVIGERAYTHLKGTFEMNLTEVKMDGSGWGETMVITAGKFNVKNQLNF